jgi:hypothetical protein
MSSRSLFSVHAKMVGGREIEHVAQVFGAHSWCDAAHHDEMSRSMHVQTF